MRPLSRLSLPCSVPRRWRQAFCPRGGQLQSIPSKLYEANNVIEALGFAPRKYPNFQTCCFPNEVVALFLLVTQWRWVGAESNETEKGRSARNSRPHGAQNPGRPRASARICRRATD